jgi:HAD superfamily hydrolase (TIGR01450 family)
MKAVILAAGIGSRLRPITDKKPKTLIEVNGKAMLGYILDALQDSSIKEIGVCTGYRESLIKEYCCSNYPQLSFSFFSNCEYAVTNNMYSLYLAKEFLDDDFLLMNADLVFSKSIIERLMMTTGTIVPVDVGLYDEESMKVTLNDRGFISGISKKISRESCYGSSIDIYRISARHIITILEAMHQIIDIQMERNQWTEVMFDQLFRNGLIEAMPLDIKGEAWYEIDTYEDLSNAEMLFNSRMHEVMNRKVFFIDKDGTISLNNRSIPGAAETINFLREQGKKVYILSNNSSRTAFEHSRSLKSLGIEAAVDEIIISTDACIHYLISNKLNRIALLANDAVRDYFERKGFEIDDECPDAAVATYDDTLTYQKLIKFIDVIRTGIPYYATHIDLVYPTERGPIPDIGCIIDMITRSTGKRPLLTFGKPSLELIKPILAKNSMGLSDAAIVGDRLYTDIAMGLGNELITVLVLSGETNRDEYEFSQIRADIVVPSIAYLVKDWG